MPHLTATPGPLLPYPLTEVSQTWGVSMKIGIELWGTDCASQQTPALHLAD